MLPKLIVDLQQKCWNYFLYLMYLREIFLLFTLLKMVDFTIMVFQQKIRENN